MEEYEPSYSRKRKTRKEGMAYYKGLGFRAVRKALDTNQFQVIAVDIRNHGDSPHSPYHTYAHLAEDIVNFLKENDIDRAALLGHSVGGRAVMYTALKYVISTKSNSYLSLTPPVPSSSAPSC